MNKLAVFHKAKSNFAYPISLNQLQVRLRTAAKDFDEIYIVYGDKYAWHKKQEKRMEILLQDHVFAYYQTVIEIPTNRYTYYFKLKKKNNIHYYTDCGFLAEKEEGKDYFKEYLFHFPYINSKDFHKIPSWVKNAAWYQIFPERFRNGNPKLNPKDVMPWGTAPTRNNFMGGDFAGIEGKLGYLKELGINVIYMTPIFLSTSNHKYNIVDYYKIDPQFGSDDDFKRLVNKAHSMGIRIVLDAVFNHCDPSFFAFSDVVRNNKKSKYTDYFFIKKYPINLNSIVRMFEKKQTAAKTWDHDWHIVRGESIMPFESFGFTPSMPKLNTGNKEVREYLINAGKYWIEKFDIDGWRLDVANEIDHFFWREFRKEIKAVKEDAIIIGEIWEDGEPWLRGDQFDGIMNYGFTQVIKDYLSGGKISIREFKRRINFILMRNTASSNSCMLNLMDSHDTERLLSMFKDNIDKLLLALSMLYTSPGMPMIYYGTEIGMTGKGDPDCRRCMLWDESKWNDRILSVTKRLIHIYKTEEALQNGDFRWEEINNNLVSYTRTFKNESILVIINNTNIPVGFTLPTRFNKAKCLFESSSTSNIATPHGVKIFRITK